MKSDPNNPNSLSAKARARRIKRFVDCCIDLGVKNSRILDIGGTFDYWRMNHQYIPNGLISEIDVVNLPPVDNRMELLGGIKINVYSGNALDKATLHLEKYDIVYSNSVIEHVGNLSAQSKMASMIKEIGTYYWIQTPAKSFPLEPHFYFPFFPYLPLDVRTFLHQNFKLGFMGREPIWLKARIACEETRLLSRRELLAIFNDCRIIKERIILLCKSYTATNMANKAVHRSRDFPKKSGH